MFEFNYDAIEYDVNYREKHEIEEAERHARLFGRRTKKAKHEPELMATGTVLQSVYHPDASMTIVERRRK